MKPKLQRLWNMNINQQHSFTLNKKLITLFSSLFLSFFSEIRFTLIQYFMAVQFVVNDYNVFECCRIFTYCSASNFLLANEHKTLHATVTIHKYIYLNIEHMCVHNACEYKKTRKGNKINYFTI